MSDPRCEDVGDAERIRLDREGRVGAAGRRHEAAVGDIEVVERPRPAVGVEHGIGAIRAEARAAEDVVRTARKRVLGAVDTAGAELVRDAPSLENAPAVARELIHQRLVVRVVAFDDVGDRPPPLILDGGVQLDPVRLHRHLVRHEGDREAAAEIVVEEAGELVAHEIRPLVEARPDGVEVAAALVPRKRERQRPIRGVVVNDGAGPELLFGQELVASAVVGRVIAVERQRLVVALGRRHEPRRAAEGVRKEVRAEHAIAVLVDARPEIGAVHLGRELQ